MLGSPVRERRRWGGTLAETAVVGSAALLLILGMVVTGLGVYRYEQVAALSREGARWAAVHGPAWQAAQGQAAPTSSSVLSNAITPKAAGLNAADLSCVLSWPPTAPTGMVTVTVTYSWTPEAYGGGKAITLTSTSTVPILY